MTDTPTTYRDGIYWRMPFAEYLAVPALSSSGVKALQASAGDFWAGSWMNPNREDEDTPARALGRAWHTGVLEPSEFPMRYARQLEAEDIGEGVLMTDTQVKARLKDLGETQVKAGEDAAERAERLLAADPDALIWSREKALWEIAIGEREVLSQKIYDRLSDEIDQLWQVDQVAALLGNGVPEVTVIWTDENGTRWKVRIDSLNSQGHVDLKTFGNQRGQELFQHIATEFRYRQYYIQAALYHEAVQTIPDLPIIGDAPPILADIRKHLGEHIAEKRFANCTYIWAQTGGVPNVMVTPVRLYHLPPGMDAATIMSDDAPEDISEGNAPSEVRKYLQPSRLHRKARLHIESAARQFRTHMEFHGDKGAPWTPLYPVAPLGDDDFNDFWLDGESA